MLWTRSGGYYEILKEKYPSPQIATLRMNPLFIRINFKLRYKPSLPKPSNLLTKQLNVNI